MGMKITLAAIATVAFVFACVSASANDVQETYKKNCAMCHGPDLKGQTKVGQMLKIPDLTATDVRAKFDRATMIKSVTEGVKDQETGRPRMKAFGGKLSDTEIAALVDYILASPK